MAGSFKVKTSLIIFHHSEPTLRPASKPITRHLVVCAQPVLPTPAKNADSASSSGPSYKNPPRQVYPPERLKHRFLPCGSHLQLSEEELDVMDVDVQAVKLDQIKPPETSADSPDKTTRKKKRKGEGDPSEVKAKKPKKSR